MVELNGEKENVAFLKLGSGPGSNGGRYCRVQGTSKGLDSSTVVWTSRISKFQFHSLIFN